MRPNIVLIMSDQQRWDSIGCMGVDHVLTPNIDRLAARGTAFSHTNVQGAICMPSRASLLSGKYVHAHGVLHNRNWMREGELNFVENMRDSGYHTVNIGKMHTKPLHLPCGFDHRLVVENKNHSEEKDDYDVFLEKKGLSRPANLYPETIADWWGQLQTAIWPLDEELYQDNFVGQRTVDYLKQYDYQTPLFMWTGFSGPHDPYDIPASTLERYKNIEIPDPVALPNEFDSKPPAHRIGMEKMDGMKTQAALWQSEATPEKVRRMRLHYFANCTVIDDWVGRIVDTMDQLGQLENTIFVYTSDHGDCLWDHHMVYKFSSHYESVVRVPFVMAGPQIKRQDVRDDLIELIDLGPTLLEMAGLEPEDGCQAKSLLPLLKGGQERLHKAVFSEQSGRVMVRTDDWKMVCYTGTPYGELYCLSEDPDEFANLWDNAEAKSIKASLMEKLVHWYAQTPS